MNKSHISIWLDKKQLSECDANMKITECKTRSEYISRAIEFYNGYLHDKNNEAFVCNSVSKTFQSMLSSTERRISRLMFKQAVETAKIFWLMIKAFKYPPEAVDEFHIDCVEEVKRINGAIKFPMSANEESDE
ncbi:MAG: hypothetical protein Q4C12_05865 [Clostridia bacterium]|nr:hypothetical protein [Clostridia bacterium]